MYSPYRHADYRTAAIRAVLPDAMALLDGVATPNACWSTSHRLLTSYAGNILKVRRSSDDTTQDVGFPTGKFDLNTASLGSFVGANSGYLDTLYDQSGNARNLTQATTGNQPRVVNAGLIDRMRGRVCGVWDGTDDALFRADACGVTGPSAVTLLYVGQRTANGNAVCVGSDVANTQFALYTGLNAFTGNDASGPQRVMTATGLGGVPHVAMLTLGAGAQIGTTTIRANGLNLPEQSVTSGTTTILFGITGTGLGCYLTGAGDVYGGNIALAAVWGSVLSAADIATIEARCKSQFAL